MRLTCGGRGCGQLEVGRLLVVLLPVSGVTLPGDEAATPLAPNPATILAAASSLLLLLINVQCHQTKIQETFNYRCFTLYHMMLLKNLIFL